MQRHLFWRKLSVDERENFSTLDEFRWIDLEEFAENNLDSETLEIINKLRKNPNGNCLCFIEVGMFFQPGGCERYQISDLLGAFESVRGHN